MKIPLYQVDAFASGLFRGNPAAICPLDRWLPDEVMQAIAAENNLSETAFYVHSQSAGSSGAGGAGHADQGSKTDYDLRWFTPAVEVDLCGHATLAAAYVIFDVWREIEGATVSFHTQSGKLVVERIAGQDGDLLALDFPSRPPKPCGTSADLADALGAEPEAILAARDYVCVFRSQREIEALIPDMFKLSQIDRFAVIATAPGEGCDFVSRFFAPAKGVPEDPVTGSAHCTLIPYWANRLGKASMFARQLSKRGGEIWCEDKGARVRIAGKAVPFLEGTIQLPG